MVLSQYREDKRTKAIIVPILKPQYTRHDVYYLTIHNHGILHKNLTANFNRQP